MFMLTPDPASHHIQKFCRQISPKAEPILLPITPDRDAAPLDCFHIVRRKVASSGGRLILGWAIWEWPRVFVEAEHHSVYEMPGTGHWMDLTPPQMPGISSRLFLPDNSATYDFDNEGIRRDNHRLALTSDPLLKRLFKNAQAITELMNGIPGIGEVYVDPDAARKNAALQRERSDIVSRLVKKYTSRNDRCFCGSGKKFKNCHGGG